MIEIVSGGSSDLEGLRDLWLELHHHYLRIATYPTPTHDDQSWQVRRIDYRAALVENAAFLLIARDGSVPVGYAMTLLHAGGPNDTFVLGPRYAELYTLVVTADRRGTGIGNELFDAVERELVSRAIGDLEIGVVRVIRDFNGVRRRQHQFISGRGLQIIARRSFGIRPHLLILGAFFFGA